jgi:hypothetical protein
MSGKASDRILAATRKGLFTLRRGASGWRIAGATFLGDPVTLALADPRDGALYAALDHGHFGVKLHRSDDGGETFTEVAAPVYPKQPEGVEEKTSDGRVFPWSLKLIWALAAGGQDEPGVVWCGTIPGGVFRSADRGASWELCESLWKHPKRKEWFGGGADWPGIHSICVHPEDSRRVLLGISCAGVWETTDGGNSWNQRAEGMRAAYVPPEQARDPHIQDPHRVVQCRAAPATLWAQHHNGIFRSSDGAASWDEIEEVSPSTFGFAVAVHPEDPDTAWFVPAQKDEHRIPVDGKLVVTRTRDGGKSFETLTRGLPQEHAYDLVYRHGLDIDASGDRLAFGSTTGSLWVSEDQGDSWQALSHHLPPIYGVHFAGQ